MLAATQIAPVQFGAFSTCMALFFIVLGITRGITSDVLVVHYSHERDQADARAAAGASFTLALLIGVAVAVLCLLGSVLIDQLREPLIVLAVVTPGLLLQDARRYAAFAFGRPALAVASDAVWLSGLAAAGIVLLLVAPSGAAPYLAAWGGAGCIAALVPIWHERPKFQNPIPWLSQHFRDGRIYASEFLVSDAVSQLTAVGLAGFVSLAEVGAYRAAQVALGPAWVLIFGAGAVLVPEGARLAEHNRRRLLVSLSVTIALIAALVGVVLYNLPQQVGAFFFGETWSRARDVIPGMTAWVCAGAVAQGGTLGLRLAHRAGRSLAVRLAVLPIAVVAVVVGASAAGAVGAAWGLAVAMTAAAVTWWVLLLRHHAPDN